MSKIILYSTGCPRCKALEKQMELNEINYTVVDNIEIMKQKGLKQVPVLEIDGQLMPFEKALQWVKEGASL